MNGNNMKKKFFVLALVLLLPIRLMAGSGDANNDGKVDVADIVEIISNYILKTRSDLVGFWNSVNVDVKKIWADANVDGIIDMEDVKAIADYLIMTEAERQDRGKALSEATEEDDLGKVIASDGKVYPAGTIGITPVAMIVYVGEPGSADCHSENYRGLAIALSDSETPTEKNGWRYLNGESVKYKTMWEIMGYDEDGLFDESRCIEARNGLIVPVSYDVPVPQGNVTSGWFMPSAGQYIAFYQSYGLVESNTSHYLSWNNFHLPNGTDELGNLKFLDGGDLILGSLRKAGDTTVNINKYSFWTCSQEESYSRTGRVVFTNFLTNSGFFISHISEDNKKRIRPFLAF